MTLAYTYNDAYLKAQVNDDRETRAIAHVNSIATFSADWLAKLAVIRAYVIVCLECQGQPDDLYAQKLKAYRQEWESLLAQAKAATVDEDLNPLPSISISLERA